MKKQNDFFDDNYLLAKEIIANANKTKESEVEETSEPTVYDKFKEYDLSYLDYVELVYDPRKVIVKNPILESTVDRIKQSLLTNRKNTIIIHGVESSGRTTAVQYLGQILEKSSIPKALRDIVFIKVKFPDYAAGFEEVCGHLKNILNSYYQIGCKKMLVFLGNEKEIPISFGVEYLKHKEMWKEFPFDFLKFIMIMDQQELCDELNPDDRYDIKYLDLIKDSIVINHECELDYMQIVKNLLPEVKKLEEIHNVNVSKRILEKVMLIKASKCLNAVLSNSVALNTFDLLMSIAELSSKKGETVRVKFSHVKKLFEKDFKYFAKIPEEEKRSIAYHEAGHALLILLDDDNYVSFNGMKLLYDIDSGSTGINYTIENLDAILLDREYVIKILAIDYSARLLQGRKDMGAASDLETAFQLAQDFVLQSGATKVGNNYICFKDQFYLSERKKQIIEDEIQRLIDEAIIYAKKNLDEYQDFLEELVENLMKEYVLSPKQIQKIWKKYKK